MTGETEQVVTNERPDLRESQRWYEIHAEYDGHVTGRRDRGDAIRRARELSEEFEQDHTVEVVRR